MSLQIIKCEQHSENWYKARLGIPTASEFKSIITPKKLEVSSKLEEVAYNLVSQSLATEQDEKYKSRSMERGNEIEPLARELYQETYLTKVDEVGIMIRDNNYGYSPDGLVGEDGLIEIKCPDQNTHLKYLYENKLPDEYKLQVYGGLFVSGRQWCDFISYHPKFPTNLRLFVIRVQRDEEIIKKLEVALSKVVQLRDKILTEIHSRL